MRMTTLQWRALWTGLLGAAGFIGVYAASTLTARGQRWETRYMNAVAGYDTSEPLLHLVSVPNLVVACAVMALIAALRRQWMAGLGALTVMALSNALGQVLKYQLLERPALIAEGPNTFPSGHTIAFASTFVALLIVLPPWARLVTALPMTGVLSYAGALIVANGWHRPSDVVGGILLVGAVAALVCAVPRVAGLAAEGALRRTLSGLGLALFALGALALAASACVVAVLRIVDGAPVRTAEALNHILVAAPALAIIGGLLWVLATGTPPAGDSRSPDENNQRSEKVERPLGGRAPGRGSGSRSAPARPTMGYSSPGS
ncbi:phosphatase PAP2 family protein [Sediminivirga luteola]|nr:phosphatase PAP2 family protein [Sediminivirga luteola]